MSDDVKRVEIPANAAALVEEQNRRFMMAREALNNSMALLRAALDVPDGWIIRDLREGFIDPASIQDGGE